MRCDLALGVGMSREPGVGQEFRDPASGMGRQTLEEVLVRSERIEPLTFGVVPGTGSSGDTVLISRARPRIRVGSNERPGVS